MASEVLCRLEAAVLGTPPRYPVLEACKVPQGFLVWFQEHPSSDAIELAGCRCAYDAHAFARVMLELQIDDKLKHAIRTRLPEPCGWLPDAAAWRRVVVTGEHGIRAHILRLAFVTGWEDAPWLMVQSDASLDFIEGIIGDPPAGNWIRPFGGLLSSASTLGDRRPDLLTILHRYGLPATSASLPVLEAALDRDAEELRQKRAAERGARIAPFRQDIELITLKLSDRPRHGGCVGMPSLRSMMRAYLEEYVIEHGRMPEGKVHVETDSRKIGWGASMGEWDFDELRSCERWPPDR